MKEIMEAEIMGTAAFKAGKKAVPVLDSEFMAFMKENGKGQMLKMLKAWNRGWHTANLCAGV